MTVTKTCRLCKKEKPISEFYKTGNGRGVFGRYGQCKACVNKKAVERIKEWRINNPGRRNKSDKKYREKNRKKCTASAAKSIAKNRKYYNEKHKIYNHNRRARESGAGGSHTLKQWELTKEMYNGMCAYCGEKTQQLQKDHVVPISKGGTNYISNIAPVCKSCNSRKKDFGLLAFMGRAV